MRLLQRLTVALAGSVLMATWAPAASADDGVVIAFETLPAHMEAGTTYTLHFSAMGLGSYPRQVGDAVAQFFDGNDRHTFVARGIAERKGEWTVEVTLPRPGAWRGQAFLEPYPAQPIGIAHVEATAPAMGSVARGVLLLATLLALGSLVLSCAWIPYRQG